MKYINSKNIEKIILLLLVIVLFSYSIEPLIGGINITMPLALVAGILTAVNILINKNIPKICTSDICMYLFILYIIIHSISISNPNNVIKIIVSSIIFYFIGRTIKFDEENYLFCKKVFTIISWIIIIDLMSKYDVRTSYRLSIEGTTPIAVGEIIGLFSLINLFNTKGINKDIFSIINYIIGCSINLFVLSSRSSFFFIIITSLIILFCFTKKKLLIGILSFMSFIIYLILFNKESLLIKNFPSLNRFTIEGMMNDPSVVSNTRYLGRSDLWRMSIDAINKNPLFGGGAGIVYSHNLFLETVSSFGLIGLSIICIITFNTMMKVLVSRKINMVLISLLIYSFLYRQFSFAFDAHKSLFLFLGLTINYYNINCNKYISGDQTK